MEPGPAGTRARQSGPQAGFSLIEVLAAMAIFMLVAVSIFTGVTVVIRSDSAQKGRSTVTVASRNYSDALADSAYVSCGTPADYSTETIGWTPPSGTSVSVTSVRYWNRSRGSCGVQSDRGAMERRFRSDLWFRHRAATHHLHRHLQCRWPHLQDHRIGAQTVQRVASRTPGRSSAREGTSV
ncbi:MAG: prepilin-type N-terminal cleavage/methylation domain-containing protein [Microthrixaceae bacterium]